MTTVSTVSTLHTMQGRNRAERADERHNVVADDNRLTILRVWLSLLGGIVTVIIVIIDFIKGKK